MDISSRFGTLLGAGILVAFIIYVMVKIGILGRFVRAVSSLLHLIFGD